MISKWFYLKEKATELRKTGLSIKKIEKRLGIPRSTLSGWLRNIELTETQKQKLHQDWKNALVAARKKAVIWHRAQKKKRIAHAKQEALKTLANINLNDPHVVELALAILYLGEGSKKSVGTSLGNSDPVVLRFFIAALQKVYQIDKSKIRAELYLRADQDSKAMREHWSQELALPLKNFTYVSIDKRTLGSKTYPAYKGVCLIRYGNSAIQRRLMFLSDFFCKEIAKDYLGS